MMIAILFLAAVNSASDYISGLISNENYGRLLQESVGIGGWVALWHPLNVFLYDWWPIRAEKRLFQRLAGMQVEVLSTG